MLRQYDWISEVIRAGPYISMIVRCFAMVNVALVLSSSQEVVIV